MDVYKAINEVQAELARTGIAKDRVNTQGTGYRFRGIDDVYDHLAPLLSKHGLCIIPRMVGRTCDLRKSAKGNDLYYVTVEAEFDFVSTKDGSKHTARTFGEAMDSGDKATNKAMSAAFKYVAFLTFTIPTEGDNDADSHTHTIASRIDLEDPARLKWLSEQAESIASAKTVGELKLIHAEAVRWAEKIGDADAIAKLDSYAEAKKNQARKPDAQAPA
jgi:hypothetical protein